MLVPSSVPRSASDILLGAAAELHPSMRDASMPLGDEQAYSTFRPLRFDLEVPLSAGPGGGHLIDQLGFSPEGSTEHGGIHCMLVLEWEGISSEHTIFFTIFDQTWSVFWLENTWFA